MKKAIALFFFVAIAVCLQAQDLTWNLNFQRGRDMESVRDLSRLIQMDTGQPFLFTVAPGSNCYCYVILRDSVQKIDVKCNEFLTKEKTFGPWPLSGSGTETFYIIMSLEKQTKLESYIKAYEENKNKPSADEHANNLYMEILELQKNASEEGKPGPPYIPGGGGFRGDSEEYWTPYSGGSLYVNPIRIRH